MHNKRKPACIFQQTGFCFCIFPLSRFMTHRRGELCSPALDSAYPGKTGGGKQPAGLGLRIPPTEPVLKLMTLVFGLGLRHPPLPDLCLS